MTQIGLDIGCILIGIGGGSATMAMAWGIENMENRTFAILSCSIPPVLLGMLTVVFA